MLKVIYETHELIQKSNLPYAVCGGYAIDMFVDKPTRKHTDFDISVFEEHRKDMLNFMLNQGWHIYEHVWDGAGTDYLIRINSADDERALEISCVWTVTPNCTLVTIEGKPGEDNVYTWKKGSGEASNCDFIEICFDGRDNDNFVCNRELNISRPMDKAILYNDGIPYLAPEVILYHKSHPVYMTWPKTIWDYYQAAHLLGDESRDWLVKALKATYPEGHEWVERLEAIIPVSERR